MGHARDIIVIGASLGGLKALCELVSGFPAGLAAAVLVVQHTSPQSPKLLADIVGRRSALPVLYAAQGDAVKPRHIYFASSDLHLAVASPGFMFLRAGPKEHFLRPAADVLFRSAAEVYGPRVIGVVLTGGGVDGTDGLRAIKAVGGLSVVQEPDEALAPSMPLSAIFGDSPDYRVRMADMAGLLTRLVGGIDVPVSA